MRCWDRRSLPGKKRFGVIIRECVPFVQQGQQFCPGETYPGMRQSIWYQRRDRHAGVLSREASGVFGSAWKAE